MFRGVSRHAKRESRRARVKDEDVIIWLHPLFLYKEEGKENGAAITKALDYGYGV